MYACFLALHEALREVENRGEGKQFTYLLVSIDAVNDDVQ